MFSKLFRQGKPTMSWCPWKKCRSIAKNLAILHILAIFFSFSCASALLYMNLLDHLSQYSYKRIRDEMASTRTMLQEPNGLELLDIEIKSQLFESEHHKVFIRLIDQHGRIISETRGMTELLPATQFPPPDIGTRIQKKRASNGNMFLLKSGPLSESPFSGKGGQLQIGKEVSRDEWLAKEFLFSLAVFLLGIFVFAFNSTFYVVNRGLKPLEILSRKIEMITESNLTVRLDIEVLPVEMESLGKSFNKMIERLDSSFNKLSHYSENLAHELKTPLNNLMLEADITLSRQRTPEEYQQVISSSMEEYGRLSQLIDRLLFLVRADNHQLALTKETIDVRQELDAIVEYYSEAAFDKGVTVTVAGEALLSVDPVLFTRAISNLFLNALNYTDKGGTITLSVKGSENGPVEVAVSDTGCGIDPELLPKLFDRYFWAEGTSSRGHKGTGLGLNIVKTIMELHGGDVAIYSDQGKGTTVILTFPVAVESNMYAQ